MPSDLYAGLAERIADRLLTLYGSSQQATMLTPSYIEAGEERRGGSYIRSEIIDAIGEVIRQPPYLGGPIICHLAPDYVLRDDTEIRKGYITGDPEGYSLFHHGADGWHRVIVLAGNRLECIDNAFGAMYQHEQEGCDA